MSQSDAVAAISSVDDLLSLWDEDFVDAAYWRLLGRAPDGPGRMHHVYSIRTGISKCEILRRIRESAEGQENQVDVPGLDKAIQAHKRQIRAPWRQLLRFLFGRKALETRERAKRALENQLAIGPGHSSANASAGPAGGPANPVDLSILNGRILADDESIRDLRRRMVRIEGMLNRLEMNARRVAGEQSRLVRHG